MQQGGSLTVCCGQTTHHTTQFISSILYLLWGFILPRYSIWMAPRILRLFSLMDVTYLRSSIFVSFLIYSLCCFCLWVQIERVIQKTLCEKMLRCLWYAVSHGQLVCTGLCCLTTVPVGEHSLNKIGNFWSVQIKLIVRSGVYIF